MSDAITRAYDLLASQDRVGAIALLQGAEGAEVAGLLGELLLEEGQAAEAADHLSQAVAAEPDRIPWLRALVTALMDAGRAAEALPRCRDLLARRPDDAAGQAHMARLLLDAGDREAALAHAREARFLAPGDLGVGIVTAGVLVDADEGLLAVELLDAALRQAHPADPEQPGARVALGRAWLHLGEPEKAAREWQAALELDAADPAGAAALLAGLAAAGQQTSLPPAFVRALFDTYADRFDKELVVKLRYDAPQALRQLLVDKDIAAGGRVLDAGCGTGLAGLAVRDRAGYLAGFDLSPRMVDKAKTRDLYDALWVGELVESMAERPGAFDLVLAADVLVYVGDLGPVMAAAARTLVPGGHFAFTCERAACDGFALHEGRRFAHGEAHIKDAVAAAGLTLTHLAHHSTRIDRGVPVPGWIALAVKNA
ncbi:methyltransferase domain-containing protein, partial [Niveispirillum sp. KHB5.9]|uniref:methyltransferase domain-containing protein n=1 Tax=Niveispirillum sp. KHB5.9 TaxID=3400269 RepID=UPI003A8720BB